LAERIERSFRGHVDWQSRTGCDRSSQYVNVLTRTGFSPVQAALVHAAFYTRPVQARRHRCQRDECFAQHCFAPYENCTTCATTWTTSIILRQRIKSNLISDKRVSFRCCSHVQQFLKFLISENFSGKCQLHHVGGNPPRDYAASFSISSQPVKASRNIF
jgi:hypothetical protein